MLTLACLVNRTNTRTVTVIEHHADPERIAPPQSAALMTTTIIIILITVLALHIQQADQAERLEEGV